MFDFLTKLFGNAKESSAYRVNEQEDDEDIEVELGLTSGTFKRPTFDDNDSSRSSWFRTHTISLESTADSGSASSDSSTPSPASPETPTGPSPDPRGGSTAYDRGTFVFPADRDFMQKVEARGLNGAHERVETVYVLAGNSYTMPTDLFKLDNPKYYASATRRSVTSYGRKMAEKVAALYPDGHAPKMLARFHTHPGGSTRPSDADRGSAAQVYDHFVDSFGTDDFEFFHGIHAYRNHNDNPGPAERHSPTVRSNGVSWLGEQYRHELALFGPKFQNPRKVVVTDE